MDKKECCKNCKWYKPITTWTYMRDGKVKHERNNGFACIVLYLHMD